MLLYKQVSSKSFKNEITLKLFTYKSYMYIHLTVCQQIINSKKKYWKLFNCVQKKLARAHFKMLFANHIYLTYEKDLELYNLQCLIYHKTQPNQILYIEYICIKRIWH